jgi:hypothetical protein
LRAALGPTAQRRWRCGRLVVELSSHGRQTQVHGLDLSRTAGDIECSFPLAFDDTSGQSPAQTLAAVRRRMASVPSAGLSFDALAQLHPDPRVRESLLGLPGPTLWFNFQGELQLRSRPSGLFSAHEAPLGDPWDPTVHVKQPPLYLECVIVNGALRADWYYSPRHLSWTDTEVEAWSNHLRDEVRVITEAGTP